MKTLKILVSKKITCKGISYTNILVYDTMGHFRSKLEFNVMNEDIAFPRQSIPGEAYRFLSLDKDQVTYKRMLYVSG